ncbi:MAG: hypothetical protein PQJ59_09395 [Spirochaetales bacterium]|nr:hypothetical protein [Spirochaetales bacterium]
MIIVTSLAAAVSVAAGGIGGVSTGVLLMRALLFSLIFAVGTALINILVDTYLPELKNPVVEEADDNGDEDKERGQQVNIVMDDGASPAQQGEAREFSDSDIPPVQSESSPQSAPASNFTPSSVGAINTEGAGKGMSGSGLPDIGVFSSLAEDDEEQAEIAGGLDATETSQAAGAKMRFAAMQTNDEDKKEFFQNNTTAEDMAKGVRTMLKSDEKG